MIQRMYHADHGYHNAYDNAEVDRLQKAGWEKQSEDEFRAIVAAKSGDESEKPRSKKSAA